MAIETHTITLANAEDVRLASRVTSPFSVEIIEGRDTVRLQRVRFGVAGQAFADTNYAFLRRGETIPWGSIRAVPRFSGGTEITYKVRSGRDFTGNPEV